MNHAASTSGSASGSCGSRSVWSRPRHRFEAEPAARGPGAGACEL